MEGPARPPLSTRARAWHMPPHALETDTLLTVGQAGRQAVSQAPWYPAREPGGGGGSVGPAPTADKSLDQGLTFNRSQRGSCSATYETLTQNQVVCK